MFYFTALQMLLENMKSVRDPDRDRDGGRDRERERDPYRVLKDEFAQFDKNKGELSVSDLKRSLRELKVS